MFNLQTENALRFHITLKLSLNEGHLYCTDIFKPYGMIQTSVINEESKIRILKLSNSFFLKTCAVVDRTL